MTNNQYNEYLNNGNGTDFWVNPDGIITYQLDKAIPIEEQKRYFTSSHAARRLRPSLSIEQLNDIESLLYKKEMSEGWLRNNLTLLAATGQIDAYRMIEDFLIVAPKRLKDWATIAEFDAKIALQAALSGTRIVNVITSGLGGRNGLMRFMFVAGSKGWTPFVSFQKDLAINEFKFAITQHAGEIERISSGDDFIIASFLLPLNVNPTPILLKAISICNDMGDFLDPENLFTTNVAPIRKQDIPRLKLLKRNTKT